MSTSENSQEIFETCYRGRQSAVHHMAYMRMAKVLFALRALDKNGITLSEKRIFDYGFGAGTFFRYCPTDCQLSGVEQDAETVAAVSSMLRKLGYSNLNLQSIDIECWQSHPLLRQEYDIFLCSHVLEHLPDPSAFLRTIRPCIAEHGVFLGLVPINERVRNPHHLHAPTERLIREWSQQAGFRVGWYEENDPFLDRFQPLYAADQGFQHMLAQVVSLAFGAPATLMGHRAWFASTQLFATITGSRFTQAAFLLCRA